MKVMIDLNVAIDMLFDRQPWAAESRGIARLIEMEKIVATMCASSVDTFFYIARKFHGTERARQGVRDCLSVFEIAPVDAAVLQIASRNPAPDFEDNVILAAAVAANCDAVCTRDAAGFPDAPILIQSPTQLLASFG